MNMLWLNPETLKVVHGWMDTNTRTVREKLYSPLLREGDTLYFLEEYQNKKVHDSMFIFTGLLLLSIKFV